jgi:hypothetical protein
VRFVPRSCDSGNPSIGADDMRWRYLANADRQSVISEGMLLGDPSSARSDVLKGCTVHSSSSWTCSTSNQTTTFRNWRIGNRVTSETMYHVQFLSHKPGELERFCYIPE